MGSIGPNRLENRQFILDVVGEMGEMSPANGEFAPSDAGK